MEARTATLENARALAGRHPLVRIIADRQARRLAAGGLIGRFREAGTSLAIVLAIHTGHRSFAVAGLAAAAYLAGAAVSRPAHGRLIDRSSAYRGLMLASLANSAALVVLAGAVYERSGDVVLLGAAAAVGLTLPALSAALRALWPRVIGDSDSAYAFDTLLYEISLVVSPPIVAAIVALISAPCALIGLACIGTIGTAVVATAPATRSEHETASGLSNDALMSRLVLSLIIISLLVGFAEGSMTVLVPAFASQHHATPASGVLLAALAAGSLIGVFNYGPLAQRTQWPARLVICAGALTLSLCLLAILGHDLLGFGLLLVLVGLALAPTLTTGFVAIRRVAPTTALTEAFTWTSFFASAGAAGAQALAGKLITGAGVTTALWQPAVAAAAALAATIITLHLARGFA